MLPPSVYDATFQGWMHLYSFHIFLSSLMTIAAIVQDLHKRNPQSVPLWMHAIAFPGLLYLIGGKYSFLIFMGLTLILNNVAPVGPTVMAFCFGVYCYGLSWYSIISPGRLLPSEKIDC